MLATAGCLCSTPCVHGRLAGDAGRASLMRPMLTLLTLPCPGCGAPVER